MKWKSIVCGGLLAAFTVAASSAEAAPISGSMNIAGSVSVSADTIDWIPLGGDDGIFFTLEPGTEYFANIFNPAVAPPYTGDALDLTLATPLPLEDFLSNFSAPGYDGLSFTLTGFVDPMVGVCTGAEAVGDSCVVFAGSPIMLTQSAEGVTVTMGVLGFFIDTNLADNGLPNTAVGTYTTQTVVAPTIQDVLTIIQAGGSITAAYSAEYVAEGQVVSEPVSLALFGFGLAGAAWRARRRNRATV